MAIKKLVFTQNKILVIIKLADIRWKLDYFAKISAIYA